MPNNNVASLLSFEAQEVCRLGVAAVWITFGFIHPPAVVLTLRLVLAIIYI